MWKQPEDILFEDYTGEKYSTFNDALNVLKHLNDLSPEVIAKYKRFSVEAWANKFKNLSEKGWKELNSVWKNPLDNSLTLTDHAAIDIYCSGMEVPLYPLEMGNLIREMSLVYLISIFEAYLESIISLILSKRPEILMSKDKTITYEKVIKLLISDGTMDDLIHDLKNEYINSLKGHDIDKILKILTSKPFKLSEIKPEAPDWRRLKESFQRRHVFIHNRGNVDSRYKSKSGYNGQQTRLFIDKKYLANRFKTFHKCSEIIRDSVNNKFGDKKSKKDHDHAAISFDIFQPI